VTGRPESGTTDPFSAVLRQVADPGVRSVYRLTPCIVHHARWMTEHTDRDELAALNGPAVTAKEVIVGETPVAPWDTVLGRMQPWLTLDVGRNSLHFDAEIATLMHTALTHWPDDLNLAMNIDIHTDQNIPLHRVRMWFENGDIPILS